MKFFLRFTSGLIGLFIFIPGVCFAHTLYLKDGRKIQSDFVWEEAGYYMYSLYGGTIGISKDKVARIEYSQKEESFFQFDIWPFGSTLNNVFNIAERNDVPLHRSGIISVNKHFHAQVRKFSGATRFYYKTKLLGHFSTVDLFFTPISRKLHTIEIKWLGQNTKDPKLTNEIIAMVSKKYGEYQKKGRALFYAATEWQIGSGNRIEMQIHSLAISLKYIHKDYQQLYQEETEHLKIQKIKIGSQQDKNKF